MDWIAAVPITATPREEWEGIWREHPAGTTGTLAWNGNSAVAIRILLADDHSVVRQGLKMFLALEPDLEVAAPTSLT